ncbi:tyrosine-type recombinase/integrase [Dictyobacter kobayashii]|uniref:Tyrosine recombinase XerC n=1 Tax=Dictyobacter kobayashii TaxID=2014872 RepID=A0A402AFV3_9CHLR|nr:tyrosine-type recombinase/integrase [Dictyobacter kobayashii]GCE17944.1 tyrosine recombinase XerC [Dictyobacter kobayashii]
MRLDIALKDYVTAHEIDNCSEHTIREQRRLLLAFLAWLRSEHNVTDTDDLRVTHLRGWIAYLQKKPHKNHQDKGLKDSTVYQYGRILQTFCHWLEHEEIIEKPISTRFKLPKMEKQFIPTFTPDDVQKLLAACEAKYQHKPELNKALTARNRAMVSVMLDTGIRRSELAGLRLCDIDRELRLLVVHRKGNKWQQVPISRDGFKSLHEYLTKYRPHLSKIAGITKARKEDRVFLTAYGEPLTVGGVSCFFTNLQRKAGIDGKVVSPHNCRRYMATTQLAMGRSPLDVQRQMGHTTLNMTNRYASLTTEQLQRSHEEFSPLRAKGTNDFKHMGSGYWEE